MNWFEQNVIAPLDRALERGVVQKIILVSVALFFVIVAHGVVEVVF